MKFLTLPLLAFLTVPAWCNDSMSISHEVRAELMNQSFQAHKAILSQLTLNSKELVGWLKYTKQTDAYKKCVAKSELRACQRLSRHIKALMKPKATEALATSEPTAASEAMTPRTEQETTALALAQQRHEQLSQAWETKIKKIASSLELSLKNDCWRTELGRSVGCAIDKVIYNLEHIIPFQLKAYREELMSDMGIELRAIATEIGMAKPARCELREIGANYHNGYEIVSDGFVVRQYRDSYDFLDHINLLRLGGFCSY